MLANYGIFENDLKSLMPEIFLSSILLFLVAYGVIYNYNGTLRQNYILTQNVAWLSILTLFFTVLLYLNNIYTNFIALNFQYLSNAFILNTKVIILLSILFVILISLQYFKDDQIINFENILLILLSGLGMLFLMSANDFIVVYLSLELISLSFYILAAYKTYSSYSTEAGIKYFILGALASCLFLYGLSFLYGAFGTTNFSTLTLIFNNELWVSNTLEVYDLNYYLQYIVLPLTLMAAAFFFKIGAAPFHMWLPDVYEGSPTFITAFFSIVPKLAIFTVFFRIFFKILFLQSDTFIFFVLLIGAISLVIGSLGALAQVKLKRLFAYSAITHTGFILLGFGSLIPLSSLVSSNTMFNLNTELAALDLTAVRSIIFYLIIYIILSINIFSIILSLRKWNNNTKIKHIGELKALVQANPSLSFIFALSLFSIAGVPPLLGFYGKLYIFEAMIKKASIMAENFTLTETYNNINTLLVNENIFSYENAGLIFHNYKYYLIIIMALLMSVISALYYLRLIRIMFFNTETPWVFLMPIDKLKALIIAYTTLLNLLFFVYPKPLYLFVNKLTSEWFF